MNRPRAILSSCLQYRYRLERDVGMTGMVVAYFGINPSTADAKVEDATTRRWMGFAKLLGARIYLAGNVFAYRTRDVGKLATVADPVGPENARHLAAIIADADLLVPCWGRREKIPRALWPALDRLAAQLRQSGKPVRILGLTAGGDPLHPLMVPYATELQDWTAR